MSQGWLRRIEDWTVILVYLLIAAVPAIEVVGRLMVRAGVPASADYLQHLVLWLAFLGGMATTRARAHLSLAAGGDRLPGPWRNVSETGSALISVAVTVALAVSAVSLLLVGFDPGQRVGFIPIRLVLAIMPLGYGVMAARFITGARAGRPRTAAYIGILVGLVVGAEPLVNSLDAISYEWSLTLNLADPLFAIKETLYAGLRIARLPLLLILIFSAFLGTPIFVVLGGITLLQFIGTFGALEAVVDEAYTMLASPQVPAIPLFTLAGFLLSESKAGQRLVNLFRALFGWFPGGLALVSILACAFFTTFTGASGVTILALGGLLSYILIQNGFTPRFSTGLLTASGAIGLMFPPSLPIIMYGVVSQTNIKEMFVGGLVPGLVMVGALILVSVLRRGDAVRERPKMRPQELLPAIKASLLEVLLPVVILVLFFRGVTTLVETGAVAVVYLVIIEMVVHREIKIRDLPALFRKAVPIIGGVLTILAVAKGLSYHIVDARVPDALVAWFQERVTSPYVFLIVLNLSLLAAGCVMDIYSAIIVLAPLFIPLGAAYGIHPVHLGVIFLANLELGYLTPPVGINLFLASYRFEQPLGAIYRAVWPFLLVLLGAVLLITYVPFLTTGLLQIIPV